MEHSMKLILRFFIFTLILAAGLQANTPISKASHIELKDLVVDLDQKLWQDADENLYSQFFLHDDEDDGDLDPYFYSEKENYTYQNGDAICARMYATVTTEEDQYLNQLIGMAIFFKINKGDHETAYSDNTFFIRYICIDQLYQKKGLGKKLIEALADHYSPPVIQLGPLWSAIPFYKKLGFSFIDQTQEEQISLNNEEEIGKESIKIFNECVEKKMPKEKMEKVFVGQFLTLDLVKFYENTSTTASTVFSDLFNCSYFERPFSIVELHLMDTLKQQPERNEYMIKKYPGNNPAASTKEVFQLSNQNSDLIPSYPCKAV
jgi:GNAT superfamily N-acetyltransferase